jgi:hypothetical protein
MDNNKLSDLQDFIPQIDTMKNRMTKSSKWFETVGHRSAFWDPDFATRQSQVCSDYINGASGIVSDGRLASERAVVLEGRPVAYSGELLPNLDAVATVAPSNGLSASYFFTSEMKRRTYQFYADFKTLGATSATSGAQVESLIAALGGEGKEVGVQARWEFLAASIHEVRAFYEQNLQVILRDSTATGAGGPRGAAKTYLAPIATWITNNRVPLLIREDNVLTDKDAQDRAVAAWRARMTAWVETSTAFEQQLGKTLAASDNAQLKTYLEQNPLLPVNYRERDQNPWLQFEDSFRIAEQKLVEAKGSAEAVTPAERGSATLYALIQGGVASNSTSVGSAYSRTTEERVKPQWCKMNVGAYTYYCVGTGLCKEATDAISAALNQSGYGQSTKLDGESLLEERATQIYNLMAIFKRYQFLTGSKSSAHKALSTLLSLPAGFERSLTQITADGTTLNEYFTSLGYLPEVDEALTGDSWIGAGMANISETVHGDGIDVLLEQEFNDGKVTSSKAKWLPKLDMFVVDNATGPQQSLAGSSNPIRTYDEVDSNKAESTVTGSFSLLDTIFSKKYADSDGKSETFSTKSDSSLFESRLGLRSIVRDIKNVIVRPPKASKDVLPASRHELIWKPTLGVFDVSVTHVSYDIHSPHSHHSFMVVLW